MLNEKQLSLLKAEIKKELTKRGYQANFELNIVQKNRIQNLDLH